MRRALDRVLAGIVRVAAAAAFSRLEVEGIDRLPDDRPVVLVANHYNGLVDAMAVIAALRRLPRFLAKATLWNIVAARPFLWLVGLIPVHRQVDDGAGATNESMFAAAEACLAGGGTVAVFPEGITHDSPRLAPIRTGAARIALGAHDAGVDGVTVVPVGITYEDKVALRSRILVRAGRPLSIDDEVPAMLAPGGRASDEDRETVRRVTDEIGERLQAVSPDFDSFLDGTGLAMAAEVSLREEVEQPRQPVPLADREMLAARLADLPDGERNAVLDELGRYALALDALHISDEQLVPRVTTRAIVRRLVLLAIAVAVLAPFAVAGVFINAVPAVIVAVAGLAIRTPVTKGTVRLLVGLVVFPLTWALLAWFDVGDAIASLLAALTFPLTPVVDLVFDGRQGFWSSLLVFVTAPIFGLCAIYLLDRVFALISEWYGWHAIVARRGQLEEVMRHRAALVDHVRRLTAQAAPAAAPAPVRETAPASSSP
jgi:glycerol-3-phosphate O-acyltransferase / dihydroxyacetone phosphate acyltransferase